MRRHVQIGWITADISVSSNWRDNSANRKWGKRRNLLSGKNSAGGKDHRSSNY